MMIEKSDTIRYLVVAHPPKGPQHIKRIPDLGGCAASKYSVSSSLYFPLVWYGVDESDDVMKVMKCVGGILSTIYIEF